MKVYPFTPRRAPVACGPRPRPRGDVLYQDEVEGYWPEDELPLSRDVLSGSFEDAEQEKDHIFLAASDNHPRRELIVGPEAYVATRVNTLVRAGRYRILPGSITYSPEPLRAEDGTSLGYRLAVVVEYVDRFTREEWEKWWSF